jgi:polyphosphate glucokinase
MVALEPDDVVLGGGNVKKLKELPAGCRAGDNANAFVGGFRLWGKDTVPNAATSPRSVPSYQVLDSTAVEAMVRRAAPRRRRISS